MINRFQPLQVTPHPSTGHPFASGYGHRVGHLFRMEGKVTQNGKNFIVNSFNWDWHIDASKIDYLDAAKLRKAADEGRTVGVSAKTTQDPHGVEFTTGVNLWAY